MARGRGVTRDGKSKKDPGLDGGFVALPYTILDQDKFRDLSSAAKVIVLAITRLLNKKNNGRIAFSERAGEKWGLSAKTTRRALREAEDAGFIVKTRAASFTSKGLATEWFIPWRKMADNAEPIAVPKINPSGKNAVPRGKNGRYEVGGCGEASSSAAISTAVMSTRRVA